MSGVSVLGPLCLLCLQHCGDKNSRCRSEMNVQAAWKRGYTGKNVVVTILDDGIERNHPDLAPNYVSGVLAWLPEMLTCAGHYLGRLQHNLLKPRPAPPHPTPLRHSTETELVVLVSPAALSLGYVRGFLGTAGALRGSDVCAWVCVGGVPSAHVCVCLFTFRSACV